MSTVDIAHTSIPRAGETANGDRAVHVAFSDGRTLFGVIDGLGHGPGAAEVAGAAVEFLAQVPVGAAFGTIIEGLHARLGGTRGAAGTLCLVTENRIEACAVGNVELRSVETQIPLMFSPGILGMQVRKFRYCEALLKPKTRIIIFSDGVSTRLRHDEVRPLRPREASSVLIDRYRRSEDDATVLVADVE
jgi:negative regulator of sigma-B (phosphoserine phosphatase)